MLEIKEEFKGVILERFNAGIGNVIFNPYLVQPEDYSNFIKFGFDFIFEEKRRKNSIKDKIEEKIKQTEDYVNTARSSKKKG